MRLPCFYDQFLLLCFTFPPIFLNETPKEEVSLFFHTVLYIILIFEGLSLQWYSGGDLRSSFINETRWDKCVRPCLAWRNVLQKILFLERANTSRIFQFIHLGLVFFNLYLLWSAVFYCDFWKNIDYLCHTWSWSELLVFPCTCFYLLKLHFVMSPQDS